MGSTVNTDYTSKVHISFYSCQVPSGKVYFYLVIFKMFLIVFM